jgi:hypothetical protein
MLITIQNIFDISVNQAAHLINNVSNVDGIISGSSILQTLYGEHYIDSDLDVYVRNCENDKEKRAKMIHIVSPNLESISDDDWFNSSPSIPYISNNIIQTKLTNSKNVLCDFTLIYDYNNYVGDHCKFIDSVVNGDEKDNDCDEKDNEKNDMYYNKVYKKIQIIDVGVQKFLSDFQAVTHSFDLSIVSNIFMPSKKYFEVFNLEHILKKKSSIVTNEYSIKRSNRIKKYISRCIEINDSMMHLKLPIDEYRLINTIEKMLRNRVNNN